MEELIEKAKKGNTKAFMSAVECMKEQLYKTAYLQLLNEQDSLDAVQETLAKAYSGIRALKENRFFKSWLTRILINECHNIQRYKSKVIPFDSEYMKRKEEPFEEAGEEFFFMSTLYNLEDIYKEVVDLRYNHDMKLDEISRVLDIPTGTVKSRLNRAHKLLRQQYLDREVLL